MSGSGNSGTPLVKKLGIEEGHRMLALDAPTNYWDLLGELPANVDVKSPATRARLDFVHLFARESRDLQRRIESAKRRIRADGMVWVSWPKRSSGVETDLDANEVRRVGLSAGLVDVKVCAVDETWSGLKFVIRVADRPRHS